MVRDILVASHVQENVAPLSQDKSGSENYEIYRVPIQHIATINRTTEKLRRQLDSLDVIPTTLLLGLVSQYDAFTGKLVRAVIQKKPHVVSQSEKEFTAAEVLAAGSLEEFKETIIEKEVEAVLRKSHLDQFVWLEKKLQVSLRKELPSWPAFIEVFERRNLFAHTNGVVSNSYLKKCAESGCESLPELNAQLSIDAGYLYYSTQVLLEIGMKLGQVLWRICETTSDEKRIQNERLRNSCFDLLCHEHCEPALALADFSLSPKMMSDDMVDVYITKVNRSIALKHLKDLERMEQELAELDKHPLERRFKLTIAGVRDDIEILLSTMAQMSQDDLLLEGFLEWPAFKGIRNDKRFIEALKEVFGDNFVLATGEYPKLCV
jgi:hypothetical protein